ncbi:PHP-associated [Prosthecobacter debontii]|uniref:PHP-associated n=1 Tax=Prosthecobacter debontii TaxID=48467 RepID=A0A1T4YVF3_9BACT|nr:PHP domain-containing protein [Prosthecobacter debontii]SKB05784.1 PHP-associated [Prosthecobacter debontii]
MNPDCTSRWLRAELHCHTTASSDGMITPDGLLKAAALQKLDAIAITDHDTTEGAFEFQRWFRRKGSDTHILIGEERTLSNKCHLIGLFLQKPLVSADYQAVVGEIHEQGGLVLVPHPLRAKDGLLGPRGLNLSELAQADAFELHNAKGSGEDNQRTAPVLSASGCAVFGGSDAHYEADVGQCVNEIAPCGGDLHATVRAMFSRTTAFRILARAQSSNSGERKYAPAYYAVKKYLAVPKPLLPWAKQAYRLYWNARRGGQAHALQEIFSYPASVHA